nr:hypothetical protein [Vibrio cholerae O1]
MTPLPCNDPPGNRLRVALTGLTVAESLNIDDFAQAVKDAIAGKLQLGEQEAQELVQNFFAEQEAKAQAAAAEKGKVAKE